MNTASFGSVAIPDVVRVQPHTWPEHASTGYAIDQLAVICDHDTVAGGRVDAELRAAQSGGTAPFACSAVGTAKGPFDQCIPGHIVERFTWNTALYTGATRVHLGREQGQDRWGARYTFKTRIEVGPGSSDQGRQG